VFVNSAKGTAARRQTGEELARSSGGALDAVPVLREFLRRPSAVFSGLWLAACCSIAGSPTVHYVGPEACALCHKSIAAAQGETAMAKTWSGHDSSALPANFDGRAAEYRIYRRDIGLAYSMQTPNGLKKTFPVEIVMGGEHHGMGFLLKVEQIEGFPLDRPTLIQARYFWSFKQSGALVLAPGSSADTPHSYESALGLVLSPGFEKQCLTCHGQPHTLGADEQGGVRCESCHGPGSSHLAAAGRGKPKEGIINPRRLSPDAGIEICAQCHAGFGRHIDPAPDDLLIANQVQALRASECFIQSGRSFSCTSCHDPHNDSRADAAATRTCLGCHSKAQRAAVCPVNASSGCIGCHMPSVDVGPLHLVDHQIRVHPEQNVTAQSHDASLRSQINPVREVLRIIRNDDRDKIVEAKRQIEHGNSFYDVARALSEDATAAIGGYWGEKDVANLEPALIPVVTKLNYADISDITLASGKWCLIQRLPRTFKWQADQLQHEAEALLLRGEVSAALDKSQQALRVYPHFRRALTFIGTTLAQAGNMQRAADVLGVTTRLYPSDATSLFALAVVLAELNRHNDEIDAYRRVLVLEPDFLAAYAKLGVVLDSKGDEASSVAILRQGLKIDPLSAELYHDLSLSLTHQGEIKEAKRCAAMAALLDPDYDK
jgi:tetratricopeptide (TPR) repeat protein